MVGNYKIEIDFTLVDFFTLLRTDKLDIITGLQFHGMDEWTFNEVDWKQHEINQRGSVFF